MLLSSLSLVLSVCSLAAARFAVTPISQLRKGNAPELAKRDTDPADLYPEYNISVPIDYFVSSLCVRIRRVADVEDLA